MDKISKFLVLSFQAAILVSFSAAGWAGKGNAPSQDVAVSGDATEVIWIIHPSNQFESVELRVSPPDEGEVAIQTFDSSETPFYNPVAGDGFYGYELTLLPVVSQTVSEEMSAARAAAGGQEARAAAAALKARGALPESQVYTGGFRILNGELVVSDIQE